MPFKALRGLIGSYIPPFLLESIIPEKAVFSPLSFIFWRGIIWTPEMWGKGLCEELFFGGVFGDPFWDPA